MTRRLSKPKLPHRKEPASRPWRDKILFTVLIVNTIFLIWLVFKYFL